MTVPVLDRVRLLDPVPARCDLGRRELMAVLGAGVLAGLTGCAAPSGPAPAGETRTVTTDAGPVTVPRNPAHVVATDLYLVSALFDMGLAPAGVPSGVLTPQFFPPEVLEWAGTPVEIGPAGEPSPELVLQAAPDLVLDQFYPERTAQLRDIAPVAFVDWRQSGRTWREQLALIADVLARTDDLAARQATYLRRVDEVRTAHGDALTSRTWAVVSGAPQGNWILGSPMVDVLKDLGATVLPGLTNSYVAHSDEQLDLLRPAHVVLYPQLFTGQVAAPMEDLRAGSLWRALPAVRAGAAHPVRYSAVSSYHWATKAVDEIEAVLRAG